MQGIISYANPYHEFPLSSEMGGILILQIPLLLPHALLGFLDPTSPVGFVNHHAFVDLCIEINFTMLYVSIHTDTNVE